MESNRDFVVAGRAEAFEMRARASGLGHGVSVYVRSASTARRIIVAVYAQSRGQHPGRRLSTGSRRHLLRGRWNRVSIRSVRLHGGRVYWLALLGTSGTLRYRDRTGGGCVSATTASRHLTSAPRHWHTGATYFDCPVSAYISGSRFRSPRHRPKPPKRPKHPRPGKPSGPGSPGKPPVGGSGPAPPGGVSAGKNCFASPGACGYPDPAAGNVGIPAGAGLRPAGATTISTPGKVISGEDISGQVTIAASNVTIKDSRVTFSSGGCGPSNICGASLITVQKGASGVTIDHVETRASPGITCTNDVLDLGNGAVVESSYLHACDNNVQDYDFGAGTTLKDDYGIAKLAITGDHVENVYFADDSLDVEHSTLLNPTDQTAVIFGDTNGGQGGACDNHLTVRNSLLAGGGFTLYPCGNATSVGSGRMDIENDRFARCLTGPITYNSGTGGRACRGSTGSTPGSGADGNGYWPQGGYFGIDAYVYCPPTSGQVWSGNVWDDDNSPAGC